MDHPVEPRTYAELLEMPCVICNRPLKEGMEEGRRIKLLKPLERGSPSVHEECRPAWVEDELRKRYPEYFKE